MKNSIALLTFISIVFFATTQAFSQTNPTAGATATSSATIITPIDITKTQDLSFGNLIANASGGTVDVSPAGARTSTTIDFPTTAGTVSAASFNVTGFANSAYTITLPATATMTKISSSETMSLTGFNHNVSGTPTLDGSGNASFNVGATLNVGANQADGDYEGDFEVTVNYN